MKSEGSEEREKIMKEGIINVVSRFEGEGGIKKADPIKLPKIIKGQIVDVKYARILGDGNLLIGCNNEVQTVKARKLANVGKIKVLKVVRVGEKRISGCKGVIYGVSNRVNVREPMESIKMRNGTVKSVRRLTRGVEKKEIESVLIEFEEKEIPKEVD